MRKIFFFRLSFLFCCAAIVCGIFFSSCKKAGAPKNVWFQLNIGTSTNAALQNWPGFLTNSSILIVRDTIPLASSSFAAVYVACPNDGSSISYNYAIGTPTYPRGFFVCSNCGRRWYMNGIQIFPTSTLEPLTTYNTIFTSSNNLLLISSK